MIVLFAQRNPLIMGEGNALSHDALLALTLPQSYPLSIADVRMAALAALRDILGTVCGIGPSAVVPRALQRESNRVIAAAFIVLLADRLDVRAREVCAFLLQQLIVHSMVSVLIVLVLQRSAIGSQGMLAAAGRTPTLKSIGGGSVSLKLRQRFVGAALGAAFRGRIVHIGLHHRSVTPVGVSAPRGLSHASIIAPECGIRNVHRRAGRGSLPGLVSGRPAPRVSPERT